MVADIVDFQRALGKTAADLVRSRPHHLRVVAHFKQIILRRAVSEIVLLQEPRLDGKHPLRLREKDVSCIILLQ